MKVTKVKESKVDQVDFDNLPFGKICTDHMYVSEYKDGKWDAGQIRPLTWFQVHPANLAWHYGQSIFEGMKASVQQDGTPVLFRVKKHAKRFDLSARRMCMPELPKGRFQEAVNALVNLEKSWIPPTDGSSLYIRPFMFATEEYIGVRPSSTYKFVIFTCPVGPYYSKPVSLWVEDRYVRAVKGGVGQAKTSGNYGASLLPAKKANEKGFDQVMWMDSKEFKYIHEVGTMNIFFVIKNKVYTPELDGCVLDGVTRNSVMTILKKEGIKVVEKPLAIDKIYKAYKKGDLTEVFGSGTAAVISTVNKIGYGKKIMKFKPNKYKIAPHLKSIIDGIRVGTVEDNYGWTSVVD